jgi:hypothetical protein
MTMRLEHMASPQVKALADVGQPAECPFCGVVSILKNCLRCRQLRCADCGKHPNPLLGGCCPDCRKDEA